MDGEGAGNGQFSRQLAILDNGTHNRASGLLDDIAALGRPHACGVLRMVRNPICIISAVSKGEVTLHLIHRQIGPRVAEGGEVSD